MTSKESILNFIKTVDTLINIGLDCDEFMDYLYDNSFKIEFLGIKTELQFGAEESQGLLELLKDLVETCY
jgi:hypothetical protein